MVTRALTVLGLAALGAACTGHNANFCPGGLEDEDGECPCFGAGRFVFCVRELPAGPRELPSVIDTANDCDETFMLDRTDRELCLIQGTEVTVSQLVKVAGSRPLVLLGTRTLTIAATGEVDASGGAGDEPTCDRGGTSGGAGAGGGNEGGGGGAGGSFGTRGEAGGMGGGGNGGLAGQPAEVVASPVLQGGCRGTEGGRRGALGGTGGGGVYLAAGHELVIAGTVNASGAGGQGGPASKGGGGGGGSGGMIVLYAPTVETTMAAQIFANGGGGGGGATDTVPGMAGSTSPAAKSPGSGGPGAVVMNAGGAGATVETAPMPGRSGMNGQGGGGGGGGLGVIYVLDGKSLGEAQVSPAPSTPPP